MFSETYRCPLDDLPRDALPSEWHVLMHPEGKPFFVSLLENNQVSRNSSASQPEVFMIIFLRVFSHTSIYTIRSAGQS